MPAEGGCRLQQHSLVFGCNSNADSPRALNVGMPCSSVCIVCNKRAVGVVAAGALPLDASWVALSGFKC